MSVSGVVVARPATVFGTVALATTVLGLTCPSGTAAQTEVTLELGGSQIGPAVDFDARDSHFLIGGVRTSIYGPSGSGVFLSVLGGQVVGDGDGAPFLSASLDASLRDDWSTRWTGAFDVKLFGFGVQEPFPYRTLGAEASPWIRFRTANSSVKVGGLAGVGRSTLEVFRRVDGPRRTFETELWRVGGNAEYLVGSPTVQVGVAGSTHRAGDASYHALGGRFVVGGSWGVVEFRADRWNTPIGYETTGGLSLAIPFGGAWSFRGFFGRSDPDPLTLAEPGSGSAGALLGLTVFSTAPDLAERDALYDIVEYGDARSRVRLTVEAPTDATRVQLLGDFTLWDPVEMTRAGNRWTAEIDVPVGTHHFGFLVDDEWYVPDDAPDVVPDEWGRTTATLVIEGAGS